MKLDIKDFAPPREADIDISEMVGVKWVKLDKLMRLPIIDTSCVTGRNGLTGRNIERGYCAAVDERGIIIELSKIVGHQFGTLSDYIDSLGIGFAYGGFRIVVRAKQTIDPEYQPERRFSIYAVVHLDDGQRLQFIAMAGIAGPSMQAIEKYLDGRGNA